MKQQALKIPAVAEAAKRISARYIAGEKASAAVALVAANRGRGHLGSIECVGESVRDADVAERETQEFLRLAGSLAQLDEKPTLSFDLSHVGSVVSPETGLHSARRIAKAARDAGTSIMISAEGSGRTDLVLDLYEALSTEFPETGVTLQARLHRTPKDLSRLLSLPGPIRLVKGAFLEPLDVAYARESAELTEAYLDLAAVLVEAQHRVNLATHDADLVAVLQARLGESLKQEHVEFEMLQGLGPELLDRLRDEGHRTREYVVYGPQWWLYVLNRMAEHPERVLQALADLWP
ncbi:proline dehydrogenase family protein [Galactobacter sp.]|uniref:proline dehydrogenase family protein n=1 Tax=Galactobacter sp. TaxID=2676125 RepID=UPI0025BF9BD2|nr:proline dehydrogenase family protein [Galactobacter sp.]